MATLAGAARVLHELIDLIGLAPGHAAELHEAVETGVPAEPVPPAADEVRLQGATALPESESTVRDVNDDILHQPEQVIPHEAAEG
jgi:hypothetical protein